MPASKPPLSDTGEKGERKKNVHANIEQRKTNIRDGRRDKRYQEGKIHQRQRAKREIREVKILNQINRTRPVRLIFSSNMISTPYSPGRLKRGESILIESQKQQSCSKRKNIMAKQEKRVLGIRHGPHKFMSSSRLVDLIRRALSLIQAQRPILGYAVYSL